MGFCYNNRYMVPMFEMVKTKKKAHKFNEVNLKLPETLLLFHP